MTSPAPMGLALVTGASSGIGADRLAGHGYDLFLVARNAQRLDAAASRLQSKTARKVEQHGQYPAQDDPNSPTAGIPVLEVWNAGTVIVLKRGHGTGCSGIESPLVYKENTRIFYEDAKQSRTALRESIA